MFAIFAIGQNMEGFTRKDSMEEFSGENLPGRNLTEPNSPGQGDSQVRISLVSIFKIQIAVIMKYVTP